MPLYRKTQDIYGRKNLKTSGTSRDKSNPKNLSLLKNGNNNSQKAPAPKVILKKIDPHAIKL